MLWGFKYLITTGPSPRENLAPPLLDGRRIAHPFVPAQKKPSLIDARQDRLIQLPQERFAAHEQ